MLYNINLTVPLLKEILDLGIEVGIVVGGGNFWRGRSNKQMDRCTSDYIGMLGTTMNALAIGDAFFANWL